MSDNITLQRWKLTVEYDGRPFAGWQSQKNQPSVQQRLEQAIAVWYRQPLRVTAAGRTDAGVHAKGQIVHVDLKQGLNPYNIRNSTNALLSPDPVAVIAVDRVANDFHARFSARMRHYQYRLINRHAPLVIERGRAWHVKKPLDVTAMHVAGQALLGIHDFSSFRAIECQAKSAIRGINQLQITQQPLLDGRLITMDISARSFLHHQVRNIMGTLVQIGLGRWPIEQMATILAARDRSQAGETAPAEGLYFTQVDYDDATIVDPLTENLQLDQ